MSSFGGFEKPTRIAMESALVSVAGVLDAAAPVSRSDTRAVEAVSTPVAELVTTVAALRAETPATDKPVSVLDVAEKIEAVRALPEAEKTAVASISPDFARIIATIEASPTLAPELIAVDRPPTPIFPRPDTPIEQPPVFTPPIFNPPVIFPVPPIFQPPVTQPPVVQPPVAQPPTAPPQPPPAAPPPPQVIREIVYVRAVDARVLSLYRTSIEAAMPRAEPGAVITAESFNALRAAILAAMDAIMDAAEKVESGQPARLAPIGSPDVATPVTPRTIIGPREADRARAVLAEELSGDRLLTALSEKNLLESTIWEERVRRVVDR